MLHGKGVWHSDTDEEIPDLFPCTAVLHKNFLRFLVKTGLENPPVRG